MHSGRRAVWHRVLQRECCSVGDGVCRCVQREERETPCRGDEPNRERRERGDVLEENERETDPSQRRECHPNPESRVEREEMARCVLRRDVCSNATYM